MSIITNCFSLESKEQMQSLFSERTLENEVLVFCYKNCSDLLWEKRISSDREKLLRSLEQFVQTVKGQKKFWLQNSFLTCSWRFFISYHINLNWKKLLGLRNMQEKLSVNFPVYLSKNQFKTFSFSIWFSLTSPPAYKEWASF